MMGCNAGDAARRAIGSVIALMKAEKVARGKAEERMVEAARPKAVARVALAKVATKYGCKQTMRQKEKVEEKECWVMAGEANTEWSPRSVPSADALGMWRANAGTSGEGRVERRTESRHPSTQGLRW